MTKLIAISIFYFLQIYKYTIFFSGLNIQLNINCYLNLNLFVQEFMQIYQYNFIIYS